MAVCGVVPAAAAGAIALVQLRKRRPAGSPVRSPDAG
jgi:hypothetical protein